MKQKLLPWGIALLVLLIIRQDPQGSGEFVQSLLGGVTGFAQALLN